MNLISIDQLMNRIDLFDASIDAIDGLLVDGWIDWCVFYARWP